MNLKEFPIPSNDLLKACTDVETTKGCRRCAAKDAQHIVAITDNYDAAERVANEMNVRGD